MKLLAAAYREGGLTGGASAQPVIRNFTTRKQLGYLLVCLNTFCSTSDQTPATSQNPSHTKYCAKKN